MSIFRQSRHPVVRWWWSLDRTFLLMVLGVMVFGGICVTTASLSAAKTYSVGPYHFALKQYIFLLMAIGAMLSMTILKPAGVRRVGFLMFLAAYVGIIYTLIAGVDVKGATRWITVFGQTVQPTEFMKPGLILVTAFFLSYTRYEDRFKGFVAAVLTLAIVILPVLLQPDFGMFLMFSLVWAAQIFMSGVSLWLILPLAFGGLATAAAGYTFLPHVQSRVARFLSPDGGDTYQVDQAAEAILSGHLFGRGAGEGVVKYTLPDAHTDFIFAVVVEEFGLVIGGVLLLIYATIVVQGFSRTLGLTDRFAMIASSGLLTLIALQVLINIGVALHVLPTTGMTLPFISYGGSATLTMGLCMGFILALTRKQSRSIKA